MSTHLDSPIDLDSADAHYDVGRALWSIHAWTAIPTTIGVGFFIQLMLFLTTIAFDRRRQIPGRFFRNMAVFATKNVGLWDFDIHGELPLKLPHKTVVVSNHCSTADILLVSKLPWEMKWLSKRENFSLPIFGLSMRMAGDVPVKRGDPDSVRRAMARCAQWLDRGVPVMVFPEGTRVRGEEIGEFKPGAFRLAIEGGASILPVAVAGTRHALPKGDWRFGRARARVTVGAPIATTDMTLDDVDRLTELARDAVRRLHGELVPLTSR